MKIQYLIFCLFVYTISFSQTEDAWVYFKDKPNAETFIANPLTMLTQKAIDRRIAQNIAIDVSDVPISESYITQITASTGIIVKAKSKWLNCLHIRGTQSNINLLKNLSFVERIEFANKTLNSAKYEPFKKEKRNVRINKTSRTAVNFQYGNALNQIQMLNGHLLHQLNYTGTGKIIAVLDSGFPNVNTAQPFQRLLTNNLILGGYNFVTKSTNFYSGDAHGTYVLSFMGGYKTDELVGTAPDASYYLFVTEDVNSENPVEESNWVEAAEEADRLGVDIITSSLGYFGYDKANYSHTYSTMTGNKAFASRGANIAFNKGILVLASAGNEGQSTTEPHIGVPAEAQNVLAIGAVNSDETYADFSSIGPSFDNRIKPDLVAQGRNPYFSDTSGNIVNNSSGTSFSCPITAGLVACLWQALPSKTNQELKQILIQSADKFLNPTNQLGYGIPDFNQALSTGLSTDSFTESDYVIYPNPTNDIVSFSLKESANSGLISIYNSVGQIVMEKEISSSNPDLSLKSLIKGIYFYKMEVDGFLKRGKIIKQ